MGKKSKRRANKPSGGRGGAQTARRQPENEFDAMFRAMMGGGGGPGLGGSVGGSGTSGGFQLPENQTDEVGRMFCSHGREYCHICCVDHRMCNRIVEENSGLRAKPTPVEEAAKMYATILRSLRGMENMVPRPSEEVFEQNRQYKREYEEKLRRFAQEGEDVETAVKQAIDREASDEMEMQALMQNMARLNPGKKEFELGGPETQEIYDKYVKGPDVDENSLTWEQVEEYQGAPVQGTLVVKAIKDESMMRQVFQCRDRTGMCRRIAAYTSSRKIPGLQPGATLKWKNPRFHFFMDGSSGARIEEDDLDDIEVI